MDGIRPLAGVVHVDVSPHQARCFRSGGVVDGDGDFSIARTEISKGKERKGHFHGSHSGNTGQSVDFISINRTTERRGVPKSHEGYDNARIDDDVTLARGELAIGRHEGVDGCTRVHRKELAVAGGVGIQSERPLNHGINFP